MTVSAPVLLSVEHIVSEFECGVPSLDEWLKRRAQGNQVSGASRTYVASEGQRVIGYYCLSSGALTLIDSPGPLRRNMPDPVPMAIFGRLAVDQTGRGKGLGVALLRNAVRRTMEAREIIGIRGLIAHAISAEAKEFYERFGFVASPTQPMTLVLSLKNPSP